LTLHLQFVYSPVGMRKQGEGKVRQESAREAIRNAAAELFAEKGFAATSTREICQRAGVTKPVLYYHFGNKEQLYEELVLDTFGEYQKELRHATRHGRTPREKLVEVLSAMFRFTRQKQNHWRLGFRMVLAPEKESPAINYVAMSQADERLLTEIIREGIRRGEMKGQAEFIAGAIVGMAISSILGYLLTGKPSLDRLLARGIIDLLIEGCGRSATER
jgi:TetR/AcrR family transcriptional regulator